MCVRARACVRVCGTSGFSRAPGTGEPGGQGAVDVTVRCAPWPLGRLTGKEELQCLRWPGVPVAWE